MWPLVPTEWQRWGSNSLWMSFSSQAVSPPASRSEYSVDYICTFPCLPAAPTPCYITCLTRALKQQNFCIILSLNIFLSYYFSFSRSVTFYLLCLSPLSAAMQIGRWPSWLVGGQANCTGGVMDKYLVDPQLWYCYMYVLLNNFRNHADFPY